MKDYASILELRRQALELSQLILATNLYRDPITGDLVECLPGERNPARLARRYSPDAALDALEMPDSGQDAK
jgi:hypothetical protein